MTILGKLSLLSYFLAFVFIVTVYDKTIGTPYQQAATWVGFILILLGAFLALLQNSGVMDDKRNPHQLTLKELKRLAKELERQKAEMKQEELEGKPLEAKPLETKPLETKPLEAKPLEVKPLEAEK